MRKLLDRLKAITATDSQGRSQASVRVLTTTYTGATDQKALNQLAELPNCEVRVWLDGRAGMDGEVHPAWPARPVQPGQGAF